MIPEVPSHGEIRRMKHVNNTLQVFKVFLTAIFSTGEVS
jgi:hypothetical protein